MSAQDAAKRRCICDRCHRCVIAEKYRNHGESDLQIIPMDNVELQMNRRYNQKMQSEKITNTILQQLTLNPVLRLGIGAGYKFQTEDKPNTNINVNESKSEIEKMLHQIIMYDSKRENAYQDGMFVGMGEEENICSVRDMDEGLQIQEIRLPPEELVLVILGRASSYIGYPIIQSGHEGNSSVKRQCEIKEKGDLSWLSCGCLDYLLGGEFNACNAFGSSSGRTCYNLFMGKDGYTEKILWAIQEKGDLSWLICGCLDYLLGGETNACNALGSSLRRVKCHKGMGEKKMQQERGQGDRRGNTQVIRWARTVEKGNMMEDARLTYPCNTRWLCSGSERDQVGKKMYSGDIRGLPSDITLGNLNDDSVYMKCMCQPVTDLSRDHMEEHAVHTSSQETTGGIEMVVATNPIKCHDKVANECGRLLQSMLESFMELMARCACKLDGIQCGIIESILAHEGRHKWMIHLRTVEGQMMIERAKAARYMAEIDKYAERNVEVRMLSSTKTHRRQGLNRIQKKREYHNKRRRKKLDDKHASAITAALMWNPGEFLGLAKISSKLRELKVPRDQFRVVYPAIYEKMITSIPETRPMPPSDWPNKEQLQHKANYLFEMEMVNNLELHDLLDHIQHYGRTLKIVARCGGDRSILERRSEALEFLERSVAWWYKHGKSARVANEDIRVNQVVQATEDLIPRPRADTYILDGTLIEEMITDEVFESTITELDVEPEDAESNVSGDDIQDVIDTPSSTKGQGEKGYTHQSQDSDNGVLVESDRHYERDLTTVGQKRARGESPDELGMDSQDDVESEIGGESDTMADGRNHSPMVLTLGEKAIFGHRAFSGSDDEAGGDMTLASNIRGRQGPTEIEYAAEKESYNRKALKVSHGQTQGRASLISIQRSRGLTDATSRMITSTREGCNVGLGELHHRLLVEQRLGQQQRRSELVTRKGKVFVALRSIIDNDVEVQLLGGQTLHMDFADDTDGVFRYMLLQVQPITLPEFHSLCMESIPGGYDIIEGAITYYHFRGEILHRFDKFALFKWKSHPKFGLYVGIILEWFHDRISVEPPAYIEFILLTKLLFGLHDWPNKCAPEVSYLYWSACHHMREDMILLELIYNYLWVRVASEWKLDICPVQLDRSASREWLERDTREYYSRIHKREIVSYSSKSLIDRCNDLRRQLQENGGYIWRLDTETDREEAKSLVTSTEEEKWRYIKEKAHKFHTWKYLFKWDAEARRNYWVQPKWATAVGTLSTLITAHPGYNMEKLLRRPREEDHFLDLRKTVRKKADVALPPIEGTNGRGTGCAIPGTGTRQHRQQRQKHGGSRNLSSDNKGKTQSGCGRTTARRKGQRDVSCAMLKGPLARPDLLKSEYIVDSGCSEHLFKEQWAGRQVLSTVTDSLPQIRLPTGAHLVPCTSQIIDGIGHIFVVPDLETSILSVARLCELGLVMMCASAQLEFSDRRNGACLLSAHRTEMGGGYYYTVTHAEVENLVRLLGMRARTSRMDTLLDPSRVISQYESSGSMGLGTACDPTTDGVIPEEWDTISQTRVPVIVDSGSTFHAFSNRAWFTSYSEYTIPYPRATLANGSSVEITGYGEIGMLGKAHHVPSLQCNILSTCTLDDLGMTTTIGNGRCTVRMRTADSTILEAQYSKEYNQYVVPMQYFATIIGDYYAGLEYTLAEGADQVLFDWENKREWSNSGDNGENSEGGDIYVDPTQEAYLNYWWAEEEWMIAEAEKISSTNMYGLKRQRESNEVSVEGQTVEQTTLRDNPSDVAYVITALLGQSAPSEFVMIIDSGCSTHMFNSYEFLQDFEIFKVPDRSVNVANGESIPVVGRGRCGALGVVLYVPGLSHNLLSPRKLDLDGYSTTFSNGICAITSNKDGRKLINVEFDVRIQLYTVRQIALEEMLGINHVACLAHTMKRDILSRLHYTFNHISMDRIRYMCRCMKFKGLSHQPTIRQLEVVKDCEFCKRAKITHPRCSGVVPRSEILGELWYVDVKGRFSTPSLKYGNQYVFGIVESKSRYLIQYFIRRKHEVFECIQEFVKVYVEPLRKVNPKLTKVFIHSDMGEFDSQKIRDYLYGHAVYTSTSCAYMHEHNGVIERLWRTITDATIAALLVSELPEEYWEEARRHVGYVYNRIPGAHYGDHPLSPFEVYWGLVPRIRHFRIFGSIAFLMIAVKKKDHGPKAFRGYMMGYQDRQHVGYRIWVPELGDFFISFQVTFVETPNSSPEQAQYYSDEEITELKLQHNGTKVGYPTGREITELQSLPRQTSMSLEDRLSPRGTTAGITGCTSLNDGPGEHAIEQNTVLCQEIGSLTMRPGIRGGRELNKDVEKEVIEPARELGLSDAFRDIHAPNKGCVDQDVYVVGPSGRPHACPGGAPPGVSVGDQGGGHLHAQTGSSPAECVGWSRDQPHACPESVASDVCVDRHEGHLHAQPGISLAECVERPLDRPQALPGGAPPEVCVDRSSSHLHAHSGGSSQGGSVEGSRTLSQAFPGSVLLEGSVMDSSGSTLHSDPIRGGECENPGHACTK